MNYMSFLFLLLKGLIGYCMDSAQCMHLLSTCCKLKLLRVPWSSQRHKQIIMVLSSRCSAKLLIRVINIA